MVTSESKSSNTDARQPIPVTYPHSSAVFSCLSSSLAAKIPLQHENSEKEDKLLQLYPGHFKRLTSFGEDCYQQYFYTTEQTTTVAFNEGIPLSSPEHNI